MPQSDTEQQLQQLRQQLDRLEDERRRAAPVTPDVAASPAAAPDPSGGNPQGTNIPEELAAWLDPDGELDAEAVLDSLKSSTSGWLESINEDLKDTNPATILLVFGLGVMVGRLTA